MSTTYKQSHKNLDFYFFNTHVRLFELTWKQ